eukprot:3180210-Pyramimonas_sp.AAC.1
MGLKADGEWHAGTDAGAGAGESASAGAPWDETGVRPLGCCCCCSIGGFEFLVDGVDGVDGVDDVDGDAGDAGADAGAGAPWGETDVRPLGCCCCCGIGGFEFDVYGVVGDDASRGDPEVHR